MLDDLFKPLLRRVREFQFSLGNLDGDLQTVDSGNVNRRSGVDFLERGAAQSFITAASQSRAQVSGITAPPPAIPEWRAARPGRYRF